VIDLEVNNYKRDGMPVSSHTPFARENKKRIEILKGLSGMQGGASSPGGIVNYVLKRPMMDNAKGHRQFLSGLFDWRLSKNTLLEAEFEYHKTSQPSVPGVSLLDTNNTGVGQTIPAVPSPRLNLNSQPWSLPFENRSLNTSIGIKQALDGQWLGGNWLWGAKLSQQTIRTHDRLAFPDGCGATYPGFCANGDFDVYDFRRLYIARASAPMARGPSTTRSPSPHRSRPLGSSHKPAALCTFLLVEALRPMRFPIGQPSS
jgi:iron complex outermembrane recepter protein